MLPYLLRETHEVYNILHIYFEEQYTYKYNVYLTFLYNTALHLVLKTHYVTFERKRKKHIFPLTNEKLNS